MSGSDRRSRREFLRGWFRPGELTGQRQPPRPDPETLPGFLRPPGALEETAFRATCERCHACAEACPHDVILFLGPAYGEGLDGTPSILPRDGPCRMCDGLPCAAACPSGALRVVEREAIRMGTAVIDRARCWAAQGQPCDYCLAACPLGEKAIVAVGGVPRIRAEGCTGCGLCSHICPTTPRAIRIDPGHGTGPHPPV
ncbi:MAG: 4Fe-4S dicluster domain-containing protein [Acidobacteriota bacterium]|nr:4Fe-4S dicluster domain-containing protein [Acidobacteriota bacterium]